MEYNTYVGTNIFSELTWEIPERNEKWVSSETGDDLNDLLELLDSFYEATINLMESRWPILKAVTLPTDPDVIWALLLNPMNQDLSENRMGIFKNKAMMHRNGNTVLFMLKDILWKDGFCVENLNFTSLKFLKIGVKNVLENYFYWGQGDGATATSPTQITIRFRWKWSPPYLAVKCNTIIGTL